MGLLLVLIGILALAAIAVYIRNRSRYSARDVIIVWAALGPFESATESARALAAATKAVLGEPGEKLRESFHEHKISFADSPEEWAENQRLGAAAVQKRHEKYIATARELLAEQAFNELLQDAGYQKNLTATADAPRNIGSEQPKIDEQDDNDPEEGNRRLCVATGEWLKSKETKSGRKLYDFVRSIAEARDDFATDEDYAVGKIFFFLSTTKADDERLTDKAADLITKFTMLSIEEELDNNKPEKWKWRAYAGNREKCYMKVSESNLIDESDAITADAIREAKARDAEAYWDIKDRFLRFQKAISESDFDTKSRADILNLREWLGDLIYDMYSLGSPAQAMMPLAQNLYDSIVEFLEEDAKHDVDKLEKVRAAKVQGHENRRIYSTELVNLILLAPAAFQEKEIAVLLLTSELREFRIFIAQQEFAPLVDKIIPEVEKILLKASEYQSVGSEIPNLDEKADLVNGFKSQAWEGKENL